MTSVNASVSIGTGVSSTTSTAPPQGESWNGVNTLFYVDFTCSVPESEIAELRKLKSSMADFRAWVTGRTEAIVASKRGNDAFKKKDGTGEDMNALNNYRAKVRETVLRQQTVCLAGAVDFFNSQALTIKSPNLHQEILMLALKGFPVPKSVTSALEGVIKAVVKNMGQTKGDAGATQFSILATVYVYDHVAKTIDPKFRMIRFQTDAKTLEVAKNKKKVNETTMTMEFSGAEWDFVPRIWDKVYEKIQPSIIENGKALADPNAIFDVPI